MRFNPSLSLGLNIHKYNAYPYLNTGTIKYGRHELCLKYSILFISLWKNTVIFLPLEYLDKCYGGIPTSSQYHPFITNILSLLVSLSAIVFSTFVKLNILYLHDKIKTFFCIYFDLLISLILNLYKIRSNQMHTVIRTHIYFRRNSH